MKILIDADGCPVVKESVEIAFEYNLEVIIVCDTAHIIEIEGVTTINVTKGSDSADFALVNKTLNGDIVVTQDYGLASMCLAKGAKCINQNGKIYSNENIDGLLMLRHENKKLLRRGKHIKGPSKRKDADNINFIKNFRKLIEANLYEPI